MRAQLVSTRAQPAFHGDVALLERPLSGVEDVTGAQTVSLTKIETACKAKCMTATTEMRTAMMAARQAGGLRTWRR